MTDIAAAIREALRDGLLVELTLADGTDYSGYEVESLSFGVAAITYGDYDDERDDARRYVRVADIADIALI